MTALSANPSNGVVQNRLSDSPTTRYPCCVGLHSSRPVSRSWHTWHYSDNDEHSCQCNFTPSSLDNAGILASALERMNIESPFLNSLVGKKQKANETLCYSRGSFLSPSRPEASVGGNQYLKISKANSDRSSVDSGLVASPPTASFSYELINPRNAFANNGENTSARRIPVRPAGSVVFQNAALSARMSGNEKKRFKTELCRKYLNNPDNFCEYGDRCQYAHGPQELRLPSKHKRYKTELCLSFHGHGLCAYGRRCDFIHNEDAQRLTELRSQIELFYRFRMLFPHLADMSISTMDEMMRRIYREYNFANNR